MVKIALVVLDGIVLNTRNSALEFNKKTYGTDLIIPTDTSNIYDIAKITNNPLKFLEAFLAADEWKKITVNPFVKEGLNALKEKGYKVFIISSIEKFLQEEITNLLHSNGLTFDAFIATGIPENNQNLLSGFIQILRPELFFHSCVDNTRSLDNGKVKKIYINNLEENYHPTISRISSINEYFNISVTLPINEEDFH